MNRKNICNGFKLIYNRTTQGKNGDVVVMYTELYGDAVLVERMADKLINVSEAGLLDIVSSYASQVGCD